MANTYVKILNAGTQASYNALETKNPNLLYFCTDTGKLYKGTVDFTDSLVVAASKPETPVTGKIYILADTNTVEAYVNGQWKVLSYPMTTTVDVNSDDMHVASAKAVYDAIQAAIEEVTGGDGVVKDVEAGATEGSVKVTKGDGTSKEVVLPGVVTTPTWDSAARKLTIPVTGKEAIEVNIGKDIFIDPNAANGFNADTQTIDLYLNDGTEGGQGTLVSIPAAALVDVYTGTTSNGTSVTVSDDNKIKVDLVVDPDTNNAVVVTGAGIKVDLSAYAKTSDVNSAVAGVQGQVDELKTASQNNANAIAKLNGSASEEGSVAKAVADARTALEQADTALDQRVTALEGDNVTNKANIATNTENIAALASAATEWGTF